VDAFDTAKAAITKREKEEGVTPSDPQASFGVEIQRKLEEIQPEVDAVQPKSNKS
jgi:hypothetical protein